MGRQMKGVWKFLYQRRELRWSMIFMLLLCWLLPLMLLSFALFTTVSKGINSQIERTIVSSMDNAMEVYLMQVSDAVTASKNASYMPTVKDSWAQYKADGSAIDLYERVTLFLAQQYRYNEAFMCTMLYFTDVPENIFYTYAYSLGGNYVGVSDFKENGREAVDACTKELDTDTVLLNVGGRIYLIRNLMNASYEPYAVILSEINQDVMFQGFESVWGYEDMELLSDGEVLLKAEDSEGFAEFREKELTTARTESIYRKIGNEHWVYRQAKQDGHQVTAIVKLDAKTIVDGVDAVQYVFILLIIFMIPLIALVLLFFERCVTKPVNKLVSAAHEITERNYGHQIRQIDNSREFAYLDEAFNRMSAELKHQFEQIYLEELALRDANIMALQSQINPHFLNNTLEIINWEARMNENEKVSGMIEALSTMLAATMNRKKQQLVPLSEELSYVDAYLYIIKQRYGEKFQYEEQIDESLLHVEVPRLIVQPIIENAVEHGMNAMRQGKVTLRVFQKREKLYIEIMDDGTLSDADRERIDILLADSEIKDSVGSTSLGIRNVNRRLKIIYGEECGLVIGTNDENHTISTLIISMNRQEEQG
ncbi:MAG: sensor histidine kinase [Lachnospiraceae bacterium]